MIQMAAEIIKESSGGEDDIQDLMMIAGLHKAAEIIENMTIFIPEQEMAGSGLSVRLKNPSANPGTERNYGTGGEIIDL